MSIEIAPLAILVMDGVGEGKLGMITAFCRTDQAKVELLDAQSTLVKWDSPKPGVVVVTCPFLCGGSFGSPYPAITILSAGTLTTQFPLAWLHLHRLLPYSSTQIILPQEKEEDAAKNLPSPHGDTVGEFRRGTSFVPPLPLSVPIISSHSNRPEYTK